MSFDKELVSIQYSLALLVGRDLQLEPMLRKFMPTALKMLGGAWGAVWLNTDETVELNLREPTYSYPSFNTAALPGYEDFVEKLHLHLGNTEHQSHKPFALELSTHIFYIFPLQNLGMMAIRRTAALPDKFLLALQPVIERLTTACIACLEHEELLRTQQQALDAMKKAEEANQAKSQFLATMSHELRTPLHGILGLTSLTLDTHLSEEQRDNLKSVKSSANGLLSIIDEILDMSRIEAKTLRLHNDKFQLLPMLENTLRSFAARAEEKGLYFKTSIDRNLGCVVEADSNRLKQILINLLDNAIKFTESGGVCFQACIATDNTDSQTVSFEIQDSGIGISPASKEKIFALFTQAEGSHKRKYSGIGLGLAISAKIASLMHGTIKVDSQPGQGSTFTLTIPLNKVNEAVPAKKPQDQTAANTCRTILLAEDNPVNRKVAQKVLEKGGHQTVLAVDGQEAIAAWQQETPDLILMDIQMPNMDGLEATVRIRQEEALSGAHVPIIALTANAQESDQQACFDAGMDYFIAKPFSPKKLLAVINDLLPTSKKDHNV
jgi:signal transduction histidine kinase/ActR/RegA family two-component response regulator